MDTRSNYFVVIANYNEKEVISEPGKKITFEVYLWTNVLYDGLGGEML